MVVDGKTEQVLEAARRVFIQYGYRRATMGDIALEAGISRPALYLVYPSKAEIFAAALDVHLRDALEEVRAVVRCARTVEHRLRDAFDIWCVFPYEMVLASPDAKDLLESGRTYAPQVVEPRFAAFEHIVAQQLAPLIRGQSRVRTPAIQIARLMVAAAIGFKDAANDVAHLRQMLAQCIAIVLASLRR